MGEPHPDWSPLGVNFKILDEHPYHLYISSLPPPPPKAQNPQSLIHLSFPASIHFSASFFLSSTVNNVLSPVVPVTVVVKTDQLNITITGVFSYKK